MNIMTQSRLKDPLEKMRAAILIRWQIVLSIAMGLKSRLAPKVTLYQRRVRAAWRVMQGREAYQGERVLPDEEAIPWQCDMACALGGSDRALIVTKFHQWSRHNKREGRAATTYNGYEDWVGKHFRHLKPGAFGGHVRALEKMGVLKTQRVGRTTPQGAYDQRKSYRIDYGRLNALIATVKKAISSPEGTESKAQTRKSKENEAHSTLNNDSKSPNQSLKPQSSKPNQSTQEQPTKPGRGGRRAGAGRKAKDKNALTEQPQTPDSDSHASSEAPQPGQSTDMGDSDFAAPIPSSAPPLSPGEADLMARMQVAGLDEKKAAGLIAQYGENRVRAVVHRCEQRLRPDSREQRIENPAGWIIRELENDVFKLGEMDYQPRLYELGLDPWVEDDFRDDTPSRPEVEPLAEFPEVDSAACERWTAAVALMQEPMFAKGTAVFGNTVKHARLVGYDAETNAYRVAVIAPPICQHYLDLIRPALEQAHGGPVTIHFQEGSLGQLMARTT